MTFSHWLNAASLAVRHDCFAAYCNYAAPDYGGSRLVSPDGRDVAGPPRAPRRGGAALRARYGGAYDDGSYDARGGSDDDSGDDSSPAVGRDDAVTRETIVGDFGLSLRFQLDWRRSNRTSWHMCRSNDDSEDGGDD